MTESYPSLPRRPFDGTVSIAAAAREQALRLTERYAEAAATLDELRTYDETMLRNVLELLAKVLPAVRDGRVRRSVTNMRDKINRRLSVARKVTT